MKTLFFNILSASLVVSLIISISMFTYATFYYTYMPNIVYKESLNIQFSPCLVPSGICSYPNATLKLNPKKKLLMTGQPYSISAMLKLPQSSRNQLQGMFMSCLKVMKKDMKNIISKSCKSSALGIKSHILMWMESIFYSPLLISGLTTESQWITVEYFEDFIDYPGDQADSLVVEIQSQSLEVETVIILIHAHLFGMRYIMHHFPLISLLSGVFISVLIVSVIVIISWIRLIAGH